MKSTRLFALAVLVALPFTATGAAAAPAVSNAGSTLSKIDTRAHVIDVRNKGPGGGGGFRMGGHGGGRAFRGGGGGPRIAGFRAGRPGMGPRVAGMRGPGRHWNGGNWNGGNWNGGHGHHHHGHRHFRPRFYGVPYYYGGYYPHYYYDDTYYEDYDDGDAVVYSQDGDAVARCEARYRSFDRASGTFLSNDGTRKVCPYLR